MTIETAYGKVRFKWVLNDNSTLFSWYLWMQSNFWSLKAVNYIAQNHDGRLRVESCLKMTTAKRSAKCLETGRYFSPEN